MSEAEETSEERQEHSTGIMHGMRALFPEAHLPPWMAVFEDKRMMYATAEMRWHGMMASELERRRWLSKHPGQKLPAAMEDPKIEVANALKVLEAEGYAIPQADDEEEFDFSRTRGANGIMGYAMQSLAYCVSDVTPSFKGRGRNDALRGVMANKSGAAVEPKKPSIVDRIKGFFGKGQQQGQQQ